MRRSPLDHLWQQSSICRFISIFSSIPPNPLITGGFLYHTASKEILDIEIAMYRNAGIVTTGTITIAPGTIVTTTMELLLLKLTVSEEEVGLRTSQCLFD
jgi:hypothetical protein